MPDAAQFTLGLFDSTAIGWTVEILSASTSPLPAVASAPRSEEDDEDDRPAPARTATPGRNYVLDGDRPLSRGWRERARDNVAAIALSKEIEESGRAPTAEEQGRLLRYIGFGASDLAQNCFPLPGADGFRDGWQEIGASLVDATTPAEYAALKRATQCAHYTPEPVIRALWRAASRLGFASGRVLEPGMGTGLFFALMPHVLRKTAQLTGIEYDPVTARIARLIHPEARILCEDYTRCRLGGGFDLVIGNPPFADRIVRGDPQTASLGLRLHDYFVARSISRLRPGGIGIFVTSTGTMDKASTDARAHIASMANLLGAVRLPEGSMAATAGTQVVIDILVFQRRAEGQAPSGPAWQALQEITLEGGGASAESTAGEPRPGTVEINEYFVAHPEMVLGRHALHRGLYGPGLAYTCRSDADAAPIEERLDQALARLPANVVPDRPAGEDDVVEEEDDGIPRVGTAAEGATIKEGSYVTGKAGWLCQIIDGKPDPVEIRSGKSGAGITMRAAKVIQAFIPIREAVRDVLRAQAAGRPWQQAQVQLRKAYSNFIRYHGPINHTVVVTTKDAETGEEREIHRRPNIAHFQDDPDCWLVASIEDYDLETGIARRGPIFDQRVIAPPTTPIITSAADALAVTLNEVGHVDLDRLAELLECEPDDAVAQLGTTIYLNPVTEVWETDDAYLSGPVRTKLAAAEDAARLDPRFIRNVEALREAQPQDIPPSGIIARLGAPWIPASDIEAFTLEVMGTKTRVFHTPEIASWSIDVRNFVGTAAGTSEWGTPKRHAGALLHDALNSATPQIWDIEILDGRERRILNEEATEAAKEKLAKIREAFTRWIWTDPARADRLSRLYNDRFNNLVPRHFNGDHLTLPGASTTVRLYGHQKRVIWRVIAAGSTYMAHAVGAGKTFSMAAAIMEQRRLGLITKAMLVVPGHCLAQAAREFLQLYPTARLLVADETNFAKQKRARFLARAATAGWDAIIITHSAFKFIAVPAEFERQLISDQIDTYEAVKTRLDAEDRVTRKRIEAMREKLSERLEAIKDRRDDMVTIEEIGIDQVIVDEAQEFRKLSFATNRANLKGIDPDGSQRAWDLYVKARFIDTRNPCRALIQASGTPIANTLGELFTLLRFQNEEALRERGIHEFDAWAAAFGDTRTELELQPSGNYKPVERFAQFVNVPELIDLFRARADIVLKDDLRQYLRLPRIRGGQRQLVTAEASGAFRDYQWRLAERISEIESRKGKVQKGDDILLKVITDGRHAAIDMRLVDPLNDNEPDNKVNKLIANVHDIWLRTAEDRFRKPDGTPDPTPGGGQIIFSDLGTLAAEGTRGFSAYRWIKNELIRLGVPAAQIAIVQDYTRTADKQRLFNEFNAGRIRLILGSTQKMGTGANVQRRLKAEHHLDVPWLPSDIEQREGRIERQGNQYEEIEIYAYATLGSMDATMWQNNERKARFVAAALSGDRSIRTIDDIGEAANQFALAKAIASGDPRLMQKAGLEAELARLERQAAAHFDDQLNIRRRIAEAVREHAHALKRAEEIRQDITQRVSTKGDAFAMTLDGRTVTDRRIAGSALLSKLRIAQRQAAGKKKQNDTEIGVIGGFPLILTAGNGWRSEPEIVLALARTGFDQTIPVPDDLTPLGLISRLEHQIERFDLDLKEQEQRAAESVTRRQGYEERADQAFSLQGELDAKRVALAALNADLAQTAKLAA